MAKMKVFELKKIINDQSKKTVESKDIQDYLEKTFGVKKTHSSNLDDHEVKAVQDHFLGGAGSQAAPAKRPTATPVQGSAAQSATGAATARPVVASQGIVRAQAAAGTVRTGQTVQSRPVADGQVRPAQRGVRQGGQTQVYHAGGGHTNVQSGSRPAGEARQTADSTRPASQGGMRQGSQPQHSGASSTNAAGHRPMGDNQRPVGHGGGVRQGAQPQNTGNAAATGQRSADGQRPSGQGAARQGAQNQSYHAGGPSQRPAGEARPATDGQRPQTQSYSGQRPAGEGRPAGDNQRSYGQGGNRQGQGYQGNRDNRDNQRSYGQGGNRQGQGYQGNRDGQRPTGDGQRPYGQGGNRQGYQGNRDGQRPYGDNRPGGEGRGTGDGQRSYGQGGNRLAGQGYQGNRDGQRPYGDRPAGQGAYNNQNRQGYQGNRPQGQGGGRPGDGQRSYGQGQGGYNRPAGQQGGQRSGGFAPRSGFDTGFQKDEDDKPSYGNRTGNKKGPAGRPGSERKNFDQQILDQKVAEKNDNRRSRDRVNKDKLLKDRGIIPNEDIDSDDEKVINKIAPKKGQFIQPKPQAPTKEDEIKTITLPEVLTIKELADKMKMPSAALVKKLFLAGKMVSLNHEITYEEAEEIALEYEIIAEKEVKVNEVEELMKEEEDAPETMVKRPPVVCVMGHVDHGKTSLLDAIRETNVTSREAGGITQHIGAYVVEINGEKITFLDTPGHEAFTSMRMRGAQATDIAILVVAADDGVMPQTIEAISHAKAAGVQIIVAINKIDKPSANVERVKQELTEYELVAEDWGGDTIFVPVSAHTKEGIDHLLEMILLTAEMGELKANPDRNARGLVIEAELDKGRGPVATILVQKGTLHVGDNVAVGASYGKVRAMMDDKGRRVKEATPSTPVEILGLNEVPGVGEIFVATQNEKEARTIAEAFISQGKERLIADTKAKLSLDGLFSQIQAGNIKELNLIIKADVQGSVEAMKQSLLKLSNAEVAVRVLHGGVGAINESDVILASTSNAIIIGFNVKPDNAAKETADREKIDIKLYRVIYNAIDDVEAAMKGMLDPVFEERIIGHAEIRQTFKASGIGTIAGSYVTDGKIIRGSKARIYRDNAKIYDGTLASLKRFQDDVKEVATGYECGLVFEKFNDVKEGDRVELYIMQEVPR